jgi:flagella synthesis protein FlgN
MSAQDSTLSRPAAMQLVLAGIAADLQGYPALLALLQEQFEAALRHQSARLGELAEQIAAAAAALEQRRCQRQLLAARLLGPAGRMPQLFALLKSAPRARMEQDWAALEQMVIDCKRAGKRNSDLLVEQYSIMQRVLHGEDQTYAPA